MTYWDGSNDWERGHPVPEREPHAPPQDWIGGPEWANGPEATLERERAWEETPLSLTAAQKSRVWRILSQELGNILAFRILTRIEAEA